MKRVIAMSLGLAMVFMTAGASLAGLNDGLVAYYPFNGNANDESGNGNHGTVYGATLTADKSGNADRAYSFDGVDDKIIFSDNLVQYFGVNDFSISFHFKIFDDQTMSLISKRDICGGSQFLDIRYFEGERINSEFSAQSIYTKNIKPDSWYVYTLVWSKNRAFIYINGQLTNLEATGNNISNTNPLGISTSACIEYGDGTEMYNGVMDELRIYNRALSESEIQQIYNSGDMKFVSLTAYVNHNGISQLTKDYANLPKESTLYSAGNNVPFVINENNGNIFVVLSGSMYGFPESVKIEFGDFADSVHFFGQIHYGLPNDQIIGSYLVHFNDLSTVSIPLDNNSSSQDWNTDDFCCNWRAKDLPVSKLAWEDTSQAEKRALIREFVWENPTQYKKIEYIEFISFNTSVSPVLAAITYSPYDQPVKAEIFADSLSEYSGIQGQNNWFYGYYTPFQSSGFTLMTWDGDVWKGVSESHLIYRDYGHPNENFWAVRRWKSELTGTVTVSGLLAKADSGGGGDGITGYILADGVQVWSQSIADNDFAGVKYEVTVPVKQGSAVDFAIGSNTNGWYDSTIFTALITDYTAGCIDSDGDGVPDQWDKCPATQAGSWVDKNGCQMIKGDFDADGKLGLNDCIGIIQTLTGIRTK